VSEPALDPKRTAVVSLDLQAGVVSVYVKESSSFLARRRSSTRRGAPAASGFT